VDSAEQPVLGAIPHRPGNAIWKEISFLMVALLNISLQSIGFLPNLQILDRIDHGFHRITAALWSKRHQLLA